jgi:2-hydroxy-3-keto-5-methylthiopentenyl-1-phosphate phosphatase
MKTVIQLDFDGTVTLEDIGFILLDTFAGNTWHPYLVEYNSGKMSLGAFSKKVFGMLTANEKTLTDFVLTSDLVRVRPGFSEFIDYCKNNGIEIVVVSHGLTFYIKAALERLGIDDLDIYAAENIFSSDGMKIKYLSPEGKELEVGFKEAYTGMLHKKGYRVVYIGDGNSDIYPSRKSDFVFATANLLKRCRKENIKCFPYNDFYEVINALKNLKIT